MNKYIRKDILIGTTLGSIIGYVMWQNIIATIFGFIITVIGMTLIVNYLEAKG